jgi:hypothetical protein
MVIPVNFIVGLEDTLIVYLVIIIQKINVKNVSQVTIYLMEKQIIVILVDQIVFLVKEKNIILFVHNVDMVMK